jgi:hypothetical protein
MKDEDQDVVYEEGHFVPLVWDLLLHLEFLTRILGSRASKGSGCVVA